MITVTYLIPCAVPGGVSGISTVVRMMGLAVAVAYAPIGFRFWRSTYIARQCRIRRLQWEFSSTSV